MSILGAVFLDNACIGKVSRLIDFLDFYRESHRDIFKTMLQLNLTKSPIDFVTVSNKLKEAGGLETVGGAAYLLTLVDFVPTAANVGHYCQIVKEASSKRQLIQYGQKLIALSYSGAPITEGVKDAKAELAGISSSMDSFGGVSGAAFFVPEYENALFPLYHISAKADVIRVSYSPKKGKR